MADPMSFFSQSVDNWGAAEWFDRLAKAIREQDKAVGDDDFIRVETFKMIAASSAMALVRNHEATVRAALAPAPHVVRSQIATAEALKVAIRHIEHLAAFIGSKQLGYSFEGLGEDLPGMKAALSEAPPVEFPYQRTFNAIGAAVKLGANGITSIHISVQAFQDAWNAAAKESKS
ncbi:hypothetical protein HGP14_02745 [Rhizobium sp. P32RR-XVIII]|uniref:hypothetical protein n=1 Tax=Rhizobium sp. P32RR-XVIII TaxID=2726738 RepID=UPI001456303F|nr:hypothetical protein [Rhizobium sp. P32RR-XVIII]NLS02287.1 hypothetical protein [Rhizobium sp. P32RR-XVIII]